MPLCQPAEAFCRELHGVDHPDCREFGSRLPEQLAVAPCLASRLAPGA